MLLSQACPAGPDRCYQCQWILPARFGDRKHCVTCRTLTCDACYPHGRFATQCTLCLIIDKSKLTTPFDQYSIMPRCGVCAFNEGTFMCQAPGCGVSACVACTAATYFQPQRTHWCRTCFSLRDALPHPNIAEDFSSLPVRVTRSMVSNNQLPRWLKHCA